MTDLETIRERVNEYRSDETVGADRAALLVLLDEAVELLTVLVEHDPDAGDARAFLLRLGRDQSTR